MGSKGYTGGSKVSVRVRKFYTSWYCSRAMCFAFAVTLIVIAGEAVGTSSFSELPLVHPAVGK